jgi:cytochrome c oxidase subunit 2
VIHSFWVPDFRCKFDVFPNRYTSTWFKATKIRPGKTLPKDQDWGKWAGTPYEDHWVFCAEYCGASHSDMYAILRVVPYDVFLKILADWGEPRGEPWEKGKFLWKSKGCYSCHSIDGSKVVGPTWKNMYGYPVELSDGRTLTVDENYIRKVDPDARRRHRQGLPEPDDVPEHQRAGRGKPDRVHAAHQRQGPAGVAQARG